MSGIHLGDVLQLRLADFVYPAPHPLAGRSGAVFGYAVRYTGGVFLFDTGIGTGNAWVDENFRPRVTRIEVALSNVGVSASDVSALASSHLHFDHCGQNRSFAGRSIYVQRIEREAARASGYTVPEWVEFPGARYETLEGDGDPVPGIALVATPGHTGGHQSAVVKTNDGLVVLAGHAVYSLQEWRGEAPPAERARAAAASARKLRALGARRVFFGHDGAAWDAT